MTVAVAAATAACKKKPHQSPQCGFSITNKVCKTHSDRHHGESVMMQHHQLLVLYSIHRQIACSSMFSAISESESPVSVTHHCQIVELGSHT